MSLASPAVAPTHLLGDASFHGGNRVLGPRSRPQVATTRLWSSQIRADAGVAVSDVTKVVVVLEGLEGFVECNFGGSGRILCVQWRIVGFRCNERVSWLYRKLCSRVRLWMDC